VSARIQIWWCSGRDVLQRLICGFLEALNVFLLRYRVCSASRVRFDLILASVFDFSRGRNARRGGVKLGGNKWSSASIPFSF